MNASQVRPGILVWLFAATIFLSAFLLFQVQPMISKYILPWFGSTPGVWATALLFFQLMLGGVTRMLSSSLAACAGSARRSYMHYC